MSDELPPMEQIIPAVEHVMGSLDHDAGLIQTVADKLVQAPGSTLDSDKATLKQVKNRLTRAATWSVVKDTGPVLSEIGGRMRAAVAVAVDSDQQRIDALAARLPPVLERPVPGGGPSPPIHVPPHPPPPPPAVQGGPWRCPCPNDQDGIEWIYVWDVGPGPQSPPTSPPPGGNPAGRAEWRIVMPNRPFYIWRNPDGTVPGCGPEQGGCLPPGPPPVPILPPPVPIGPPIIVPPVPVPPPTPLPSVSPCGPLPTGIPSVAVYVVPWLDPGDPSASAFSECGQKMIADAQYTLVPAAPIAAALSRAMGYADVVSDLDQGEDGLPSNQGLIYRQ